jgi:predicted amidohydrolase
MRLCAAQTRPVTGDIAGNVVRHKEFIKLASANRADIIIFPELSITGYEPTLANGLATEADDSRFDDFQVLADTKSITIGIGVPIRACDGICISLVVFQPDKRRKTYSKMHIHSDEEPFFVRGQHPLSVRIQNADVALAICYELSVPEHAEKAFQSGAGVYVASVAKAAGVEHAEKTLADTAKKHSMIVLMSNCIGHCGNFESAGRSAVWDRKGVLVGQLDGKREGILIFDTITRELITRASGTPDF